MVKVKTVGPKVVSVKDMAPGDLAEIVYWTINQDHVGKVVQRIGNELVGVGLGNIRDRLWGPDCISFDGSHLVRVLGPGTELVIE